MATPFLGLVYLQAAQSQKEVTVNDALDKIDAWAANPAEHPVRSSVSLSGAHTLSATEAASSILEFTGSPGAAVNVTLDDADVGMWVVANLTTGGFAITLKTPAGTGVAVANGKRAILYSDGTNVVRATLDA
jgi:hypothetical protein